MSNYSTNDGVFVCVSVGQRFTPNVGRWIFVTFFNVGQTSSEFFSFLKTQHKIAYRKQPSTCTTDSWPASTPRDGSFITSWGCRSRLVRRDLWPSGLDTVGDILGGECTVAHNDGSGYVSGSSYSEKSFKMGRNLWPELFKDFKHWIKKEWEMLH
jgi:hypothetical protein